MGPDAAFIDIRGVSKRFGAVTAVDGVSLSIARGEFFSLLGPSGCGKTTLLRMIAGLEGPDSGTIHLDQADVTGAPAHRRPVNLVFQQYALFPHLNVERNVGFGLRYKSAPKSEWAGRVEKALRLVRLVGLGHRKPGELSGGQRQRVALARALVLEPKVLLLDEPLGALDQKLRKEMRVELKNLQRELGITFVFVTHDQEEALTMSDRIAVMNHGKVEQVGPAEEVFERPSTEFAAEFMGAGNFFEDESSGRFVVRPEKLRIGRDAHVHAAGHREVTIEHQVYQGISRVWTVRDGEGKRYSVYEQNDEAAGHGALAVGERAVISWFAEHVVPLDGARRTTLLAEAARE